MVRSVEIDGVMALVEIEAGPHLVTAAVTRDAVEELGLAPGVPATAAVKATSVMVEREVRRLLRLSLVALVSRDAETTRVSRPPSSVSAASSMTEALATCARARCRGASVKLWFAGSDELAAQIRQGGSRTSMRLRTRGCRKS